MYMQDCEACNGDGEFLCSDCHGSGEGRTSESICRTCGGEGVEPCDECEGTGQVEDEDEDE